MHDRGMQAVAKELRERGLDVVRFNFPYSEKKSGRPDPMPVLRGCIEAVMSEVEHVGRLIIGGRSWGTRAASMLAADKFSATAVAAGVPAASAGKRSNYEMLISRE
jgi:predicted alpha/beta-hydrolase family hydrolase